MDELVHYAVADRVATITLDSPGNRNALSSALVTQLMSAIERAESDSAAAVVVIRSADRVFCSGADLAEASAGGMADGALRIVALQRLIVALDKPVVTEVLGAVRAGGLGIVAASDIAVVADEATFALTEVKLGLAAAIISLTVHHRMTSRGAALATLGGEAFTGRQAAEWGLATVAVPAEHLTSEVARLAATLATGDPQGLRESKRLLNADLMARIDERGADLADLSAQLFASESARAAMTAFLERRGR